MLSYSIKFEIAGNSITTSGDVTQLQEVVYDSSLVNTSRKIAIQVCCYIVRTIHVCGNLAYKIQVCSNITCTT